GSFIATAGTVYRCLFNEIGIHSGQRLLVEGAASEPGQWAVKLGLACGAKPIGVVSTAAHATAMRALGVGAVNRQAQDLADRFTQVPADPKHWAEWRAQGEAWLTVVRAENDQAL